MAFSGPEKNSNVPAAKTHSFLSLAPTTSASYPLPLTSAMPAAKAISAEGKPAVSDEALALAVPLEKTSRSSSSSSDGSLMQKRRFLKLGPAHFGVSEGDWSEEVVE